MDRDAAYRKAEHEISCSKRDSGLELVLSRMGLTELPESICELSQLHTLNLSNNNIQRLPESIGHLTQLRSLDIGNNPLQAIPDSIGQLARLRSLDIEGIPPSIIPKSIERLTRLRVLNWSNTTLTALPEFIQCFTRLLELNISDTRLSELPKWISQLNQLRFLNLCHNNLRSLPSQFYELHHLEELFLHTNNFLKLDAELFSLSKLIHLSLARNPLIELPTSIGDAQNLKSLTLGSTRIGTIPSSFRNLKQLENLFIGDARIDGVPEWIGELKSLKILDLAHGNWTVLHWSTRNRAWARYSRIEKSTVTLEKLPDSIKLLSNLTELYLHGHDKLKIPIELLGPDWVEIHEGPSQDRNSNVKNIIDYYFAQLHGVLRPLNEVKVLVVGESEVGKTSLIRQLLGHAYNPIQDKTHGIERHRLKLSCGKLGDVRLNIWDFGGQDIMHATHQFFLTHRSLYLLVIDSRQNERQSRIDYWLRLIASYGGDSPVIVVCNKADQQVLQLNWSGLQKDYPQIVSFAKEVSCYQFGTEDRRKGLTELKQHIAETVENKVDGVDRPILTTWLNFKDELEKDSRDYLTLEEYNRLAESKGLLTSNDRDVMLTLMHRLGSVLHFSEHAIFSRDPENHPAPVHVEELNVLHPEWVTSAIYKLLNDPELIRNGGVLNRGRMRRSLAELSAARYPASKEDFIISMMKRFEICFAFDGDQDRWLLPDLLHKDEVDTGTWHDALCFRYQYRVLPSSIMGRLMVRMHSHIANRCIWRTGAKLKLGLCEALVKSKPEEARLDISIRGGGSGERRELLSLIRGTLFDIHKSFSDNLGVHELVAVPENAEVYVNFHKLLLLEENGVAFDSEVVNGALVKVNVAEALNGVVDRLQREGERARLPRIEGHWQTKDEIEPKRTAEPPIVWWKTWPAISAITAVGAGVTGLILLKWENATARVIISLVAVVFIFMMSRNPKLRFRRAFQWALFCWMGSNAAGVAVAAAWKNDKGEAMFNWDGTIGWSFNIVFAVVAVITGYMAYQEWRNENKE